MRDIMRWVVSGVYPKWDHDKEKREKVYQFWNEFYTYAKEKVGNKPYNEKTANKRYKEGVIALLDEFRSKHSVHGNQVIADPEKLLKLQLEIENLTMLFDEKSMFKSTTNLLKRLIDSDKESARDFLRDKLTLEEDLALIAELGQYTL